MSEALFYIHLTAHTNPDSDRCYGGRINLLPQNPVTLEAFDRLSLGGSRQGIIEAGTSAAVRIELRRGSG